MYSSFYRLSGKPFQLSPDHRFFFGSSGHQKAMAYLQFGLHQGEGFVVITGEIGAGKTTLIGHLLEQLDSAKYFPAKIVTTQLEADDTLRLISSTLGLTTRGLDKATLLGNFERFLMDNQRRGRRILVIVDEVQNLPLKSLEELRMLSNFQIGNTATVQFCLLGQPQFRETLASDDLVQLRQRVVASYHLGPLNAAETRAYVEHRLQLVDWRSDPVLTDEAYERIHHFAAGVPRRINVLCDRLFLCGMLAQLHQLDETVVDGVASEMSLEGVRGKPGNGHADPVARTDVLADIIDRQLADMRHRVQSVEKRVEIHDRTIQRGIELAATYLNGGSIADDLPKQVASHDG
jgi:general secretion pathway protein A